MSDAKISQNIEVSQFWAQQFSIMLFFKVVSHFLNFLNFEMSNTKNLQAIDRLVAAGGISYPSI